MSDNSRIEWTDATWNPTTGCTKVSPGCDHCYAEGIFNRFNGPGAFDTLQLRPERLDQPLRWRKPRRVFVNSMSDLFHDDVSNDYIARVFAIMAATPQHTFQILTKRHARMRSLLSDPLWWNFVTAFTARFTGTPVEYAEPLPNVWLGVSVETQQWADIRIPALLDTPAAVRFLSCEPLLGPVNIDPWRMPDGSGGGSSVVADTRLDWVIVGGESGPGARPMEPQWAYQLRDQCHHGNVPFFFKQWGAHDPTGLRVGKHKAGRLLDGRTWDEYPEPVPA